MTKPVLGGIVAVMIVAAGSPLKAALLALLLVIAYVVLAVVKPLRPCGRCKGRKRGSKRWLGLAGPMGACPRCKGLRKHSRFGARAVHRLIWMVRAERDATPDQPEGEAVL